MDNNEIIVKMILDRWFALIDSFENKLNEVSDDDLLKEIAPGKNRGIYLLGHLIAVHDDMMRLLNWGDKMYPALAEPFIKQPDKAVSDIPSAQELRTMWRTLNAVLTEKINAMQPAAWFEGHTAVTAEDFAKEPHRNKLNIMLTRTTHLAYHGGQFAWVKEQ